MSVCYCIVAERRELDGWLGKVFYYNNKITRAFNTPSTLHTHLPILCRHQKLPFYIFVASSRNFPRYLFQLKARFHWKLLGETRGSSKSFLKFPFLWLKLWHTLSVRWGFSLVDLKFQQLSGTSALCLAWKIASSVCVGLVAFVRIIINMRKWQEEKFPGLHTTASPEP